VLLVFVICAGSPAPVPPDWLWLKEALDYLIAAVGLGAILIAIWCRR
jgi:hypothetical protein